MSGHTQTTKNPFLRFATLPIVGVLGVVYADIGTSPLYAINELVNHGVVTNNKAVLGCIALVFWAITLTSFKYLMLVLRADHQREGGVFALLNLLKKDKNSFSKFLVTALVLGAGLLVADGILTPAISVLSAVEGTELITASLANYVVPITLVILLALFMIQRKGTHTIGSFFGPIMIIWFSTIGLLGIRQIAMHPAIFEALNPINILYFLREASIHESLVVLGFVVLVITGGEALYADMGHFGRKPIQVGWFGLVYPALVCSYLGQGAFLLSGQTIKENNLFFSLVPHTLLPVIVILATVATIIASQALITGAYSLAIQAIELHLMPRVRSLNTNALHKGQVYVPFVNWFLMIGCMSLVVLFKSSTNLASAYGLSVASVMLLTSLSMARVSQVVWGWPKWMARTVFGGFVVVDFIFWIANTLKFTQGGYIPFMIGVFLFVLMTTWRWGRNTIMASHKLHGNALGYKEFLHDMQGMQVVGSSFICMIPSSKLWDKKIPLSLQEYKENHGSYPRHVVLLHFKPAADVPLIKHAEALKVTRLVEQSNATHGAVDLVQVRYGFMQQPNLNWVMHKLEDEKLTQLKGNADTWGIMIVRENLRAAPSASAYNRFRARLFDFVRVNSRSSYRFFTDDTMQNRIWNVIENITVH
jgi:KUP system potassium uptake protein